MNVDFTYRDYITIIFNGILLDVSMLFVFGLDCFWGNEILRLFVEHEFIGSVVAIPFLFLEGHLLLALDKIFFSLLGRSFYLTMFKQGGLCRFVFYSFMWCRIYAQKLYRYRKSIDEIVIKNDIVRELDLFFKNKKKKNSDKNIIASNRYYAFADFFKGVCLTSLISIIASIIRNNNTTTIVFIVVLFLSLVRQHYYSRLWVKENYPEDI